MQPSLLHLTSRAQISRVAQTGRGKTTAVVAADLPCAIHTSRRLSYGPDGPLMVTWNTIILRPTISVEAGDTITVDGGDVWQVRDTKVMCGPNGKPSHIEAVAW